MRLDYPHDADSLKSRSYSMRQTIERCNAYFILVLRFLLSEFHERIVADLTEA
jgi:hypothetical protein